MVNIKLKLIKFIPSGTQGKSNATQKRCNNVILTHCACYNQIDFVRIEKKLTLSDVSNFHEIKLFFQLLFSQNNASENNA